MGSVCSEIPELPEIVEGVTEGNMLEVEMDGNKVSCQLNLAEYFHSIFLLTPVFNSVHRRCCWCGSRVS